MMEDRSVALRFSSISGVSSSAAVRIFFLMLMRLWLFIAAVYAVSAAFYILLTEPPMLRECNQA